MTNFERIKKMNEDELAGFLADLIEQGINCAKNSSLPCYECVISDICGRESSYLREEY